MDLSPLVSRLSVPVIVTPLGGGMLVGPFVAGAIRARTGRYDEAILFAAGCLACACIIFCTSVLYPLCNRAAAVGSGRPSEHSPWHAAGFVQPSTSAGVENAAHAIVAQVDSDHIRPRCV